ncbi:MAG: hypothetical protein RLZZ350_1364, partial [Verrucomicrobiota bacterium]
RSSPGARDEAQNEKAESGKLKAEIPSAATNDEPPLGSREWWFRPQPKLRIVVVLALLVFFAVFGRKILDVHPVMLVFVFGFGIALLIATRPLRSPKEKVESGKLKVETSTRCSRTAIVGAVWVALALPLLIKCVAIIGEEHLTLHTLVTTTFPQGWVGFLIGVGIATPLSVTILGWLAVSQIRRSAGKLYGMKLAVFEGLFFPLLLLDAALLAALLGLYAAITGTTSHMRINFFLLCLMLLALQGVDWLIIRRVWRAVNQTRSRGRESAPTEPVRAAEDLRRLTSAATKSGTRFWRWLAVAVVAMLLLLAVALVLPVLWSYSRYKPAHGQAKMVSPADAQKLSFGPVVERVLNDLNVINYDVAIQFQTGELLSLPPVDRMGQQTWILTNGTTLLATQETGHWILVAACLRLGDFPAERWDKADAAEVAESLLHSTRLKHPDHVELAEVSYLLPEPLNMPYALSFQTHEGAQGVLQITGFTEKPRGVKLRYKLVQAAGKNATLAHGFIRQFGSYPLDGNGGGLALTPTGSSRGSFEITRVEGTGREAVSIPDFFKQAGWFVYVESAERIWTFDGVRQLDVVAPNGRYSAGDSGVRALCPAAVWEALPEAVRKFYRENQTDAGGRAEAGLKKLSFGPVVECVIEPSDNDNGYDLDTGRTMAVGDKSQPGADVVVRKTAAGELSIFFVGTRAEHFPDGEARWSMAGWIVATNLAIIPKSSDAFMNVYGLSWHQALVPPPSTRPENYQPETYEFQTREGAQGVLQILGFTENPRGVKLRYKLVQEDRPSAAIADNIPAKSILFINCPVSKVLEIYAALTQATLDMDASVRKSSLTISYANATGLSREEAIHELERALQNQAGITATHLGAKLIKLVQGLSAPLVQSLSTTQSLNLAAPGATTAAPPAGWADLTVRLNAAKGIAAFPDRDAALAVVARDAALAGAAELARTALGQMTAFPERDKAALKVARALVKLGQRDAAIEIAKTMTAFPQRDAALQELAQ